jgi:predicted nucleotide-binding protein (sugar kinase/HSP70/actin superfamily)
MTARRRRDPDDPSTGTASGSAPGRTHYRRPRTPPFLRSERDHTTVLLGGLTTTHDQLAEAALRSLGYRCRALPPPDLDAFQTGREFQNHAYCNPAYFTVGNLIRYLQGLETAGRERKEIIDRHVFVTAGSCGTCRFGMYEEEYRVALRNAGFGGFRVLTFGIDRSPGGDGEAAGLETDLDFYLALVNALDAADILNQLACQIRPYERRAGATDEALARARDLLYRGILERRSFRLGARTERFAAALGLAGAIGFLPRIRRQLTSRSLVEAMQAARNEFDTVKIDRFRVRPIVKLTGEFWAQTTDGDGNFRMVRFLEGERAEVLIDRPVGTRLMYSFHMAKAMARSKRSLHESGDRPSWRRPRSEISRWLRYLRKQGLLTLAEFLLRRENTRLLKVLGATLHAIVPQRTFRKLAAPYYDWRCYSGETHLEIAENIYYQTHSLCHMVLGLKPFGCLPSTQSDGAQTAVLEDYPDLIYLPIETSGDSEALAYSRVQMALDGAREKARREFDEALAESGRSLVELRAFVARHPELSRPTRRIPERKGVAVRAASFVWHVSERMSREERARAKAALPRERTGVACNARI